MIDMHACFSMTDIHACFSSYMYWTDWVLRPSEVKAKIEKSTLDGNHRVVLVNTSIQWPNSITLDYVTKRLYWTDAYFDRIESIRVDGSDRKVSAGVFLTLLCACSKDRCEVEVY